MLQEKRKKWFFALCPSFLIKDGERKEHGRKKRALKLFKGKEFRCSIFPLRRRRRGWETFVGIVCLSAHEVYLKQKQERGHKKVWWPEREKGKKQQTCSILFPFFFETFFGASLFVPLFFSSFGGNYQRWGIFTGGEGGRRKKTDASPRPPLSHKWKNSRQLQNSPTKLLHSPIFLYCFLKIFLGFFSFFMREITFLLSNFAPILGPSVPPRCPLRPSACAQEWKRNFFVSFPSYFGGSKHK